jgi:hypothetical protein
LRWFGSLLLSERIKLRSRFQYVDKKLKKELVRQFKQRELSEARKKMCLAPDQLRELLAYLDAQIFGLGIPCDHTLARTETWARGEGLDAERVLASVREFGGFCDCEVAHNVTPDVFGWDRVRAQEHE